MRNIRRTAVLLFAMAAILCAAVGGTAAYLVASTPTVTNTFAAPKLETEIRESFDGEVKNSVRIANTGGIPAWIRAAVVVTWQDAAGHIHAQRPVAGRDYSVSWTLNGWVRNGSYYYCTAPVAPGGETGVLFTNCRPLKAAPAEGYALHVEIFSEAVQAEPIDAVREAWGFVPGSGGGATE